MNFRDEIMVIEYGEKSIQVLGVSVWEGMPVESVRVVPLDQTAEHQFLFVVPDYYIARLKQNDSFEMFKFALTKLGESLLSDEWKLD
jgi:hypothetical protein